MALSKIETKFEKLVAMVVSGTNKSEIATAKRQAKKMAEENGFILEQEIKCYSKFSTIDRQRIVLIQLENGTAYEVPPLTVSNSKSECEALKLQLEAANKEIASLKRKISRLGGAKTKAKAVVKPRRKSTPRKKKVALLLPFLR